MVDEPSEDDPPAPAKFKYPELSAEDKERRKFRREMENVEQRTKRKRGYVWAMSRDFYTKWINEDEQVSPETMIKLAQRAWTAATIYWDYVEKQTEDFPDDD